MQDLLAGVSGPYDGNRFWDDPFLLGVFCGVVALLLITLILRALYWLFRKVGEKCEEFECTPRAR